MNTLSWKKGLFSCVYSISQAGRFMGKLIENRWSQSAAGEINNKRLFFRVIHRLVPSANIMDRDTSQVIGRIKFSAWWSKASIYMGDKKYTWKFTNLLATKWKITDQDGNVVHYKGHVGKGEILGQVEDNVLLLAGLFIGNYFWKMTQIYILAIVILLTHVI